jgi:hypothetical protein
MFHVEHEVAPNVPRGTLCVKDSSGITTPMFHVEHPGYDTIRAGSNGELRPEPETSS